LNRGNALCKPLGGGRLLSDGPRSAQIEPHHDGGAGDHGDVARPLFRHVQALLTAFAGSAAFTTAGSTFSGFCTPVVTSTCIVMGSMLRVRIKVKELWWMASSTARTPVFAFLGAEGPNVLILLAVHPGATMIKPYPAAGEPALPG
jgi:hypothetical protein